MTSDEPNYTVTPNRVRVLWSGFDWQLDAIDTATGRYTETAWTYDTHAEAIAAVPDFVRAVAPAPACNA